MQQLFLIDNIKDNFSRIEELKILLKKRYSPEENYYDSSNISDWIQEWEFKKYNIDIYTHKIHEYPATFPPQLVRKLILEYSKENDIILDIFCGSGTALVEAKAMNRNSIGIDLNPLACLISKVKTTQLEENTIIKGYEHFWKTYKDAEYAVKTFPNIDFWFDEEVINIFSKIINSINYLENKDFQDILKISFSSIVRKLSFCKHSGFKMHKDVKKEKNKYDEIYILNEFHYSFLQVIKGIIQINQVQNNAKIEINNCDSKRIKFDKQVDLIITSPPYGDSRTTVAYGQYSRLQSQWLDLIDFNDKGHIDNIDKTLLGGDIKDVDINDKIIEKSPSLKQAIYAMKYSVNLDDVKNIKRIKDVISFYLDLNEILENFSKVLKNNKYFILVVGSRTVKNIKLNTDLIIAELANHYNLTLEAILYREIQNKRMPSKVSATNIIGEVCDTMNTESIIILRKTENNIQTKLD